MEDLGSKPQDGLNVPGEIRFQDVDSFFAWAKGNEARYPIRIHNIGAIPSYARELVIQDQRSLDTEEGNIRWFTQALKDAIDYIPVSQAP